MRSDYCKANGLGSKLVPDYWVNVDFLRNRWNIRGVQLANHVNNNLLNPHKWLMAAMLETLGDSGTRIL